MILQSSVKETISYVTESVLLGMDSNGDPDRYRANLIHIRNDDNSKNNIYDPTDLGDGCLCHIFRCVSRRYQFQNNASLLIMS